MKTTVCRKETFTAAHRLFRADWTDEQNQNFYGKCSYPNYHGHNYTLIVKITGEVNRETGYLIDLKDVSKFIKEEVTEPFDHKNLNLDCIEFKDLIPTAENIAAVIWNKLRIRLQQDLELKIVLYETEKNFVEYEGV